VGRQGVRRRDRNRHEKDTHFHGYRSVNVLLFEKATLGTEQTFERGRRATDTNESCILSEIVAACRARKQCGTPVGEVRQ
jgi:hypothetical protein